MPRYRAAESSMEVQDGNVSQRNKYSDQADLIQSCEARLAVGAAAGLC